MKKLGFFLAFLFVATISFGNTESYPAIAGEKTILKLIKEKFGVKPLFVVSEEKLIQTVKNHNDVYLLKNIELNNNELYIPLDKTKWNGIIMNVTYIISAVLLFLLIYLVWKRRNSWLSGSVSFILYLSLFGLPKNPTMRRFGMELAGKRSLFPDGATPNFKKNGVHHYNIRIAYKNNILPYLKDSTDTLMEKAIIAHQDSFSIVDDDSGNTIPMPDQDPIYGIFYKGFFYALYRWGEEQKLEDFEFDLGIN